MKIFTHFGAWAGDVMEEMKEEGRRRDDEQDTEVNFKVNKDA